jgi:hypothetical protein
LNPDEAPPEPGTEADNLTAQLALLLETAMKFWPEGSNFQAWPRDQRGRFEKKGSDDAQG